MEERFGDRGREDIKGERGEQKKENIYIYMARKLALLPPLGKKADNFLWIACLRIVASGVEGGRDKFRMLFNNAY